MHRRRQIPPPRVAPLATLALMASHALRATALTQSFCSSQNSGSNYAVYRDPYQTNGLCYDHCKQNYNYAVVQYTDCWCTNSLPDSSVSVSNCNVQCPGYPSESCGNQGSGLYGYVLLPNAPSGATIGSGSGSSPSPSPVSTATIDSGSRSSDSFDSPSRGPPSRTSLDATFVFSSTDFPPSQPSSTAPPTYSSSSDPPTSSESFPSTQSVQPVTSIQVVTLPGGVTTRTVTSSPSPTLAPEGSSSDQQPLQRNDISGGAIAGIVIGVIGGVALLLALGFFFCVRRRTTADDASEVDQNGRMRRTTSVLSRTGLLSSRNRGQSMAERSNAGGPLYINTNTGNNSTRHSALFGGHDADNHVTVTPNSPLGGSNESNGSRRQSRPLVYDQRLNPSALFANHEANGSRVSMQDQQDYSRPLGVTNPDPRSSFDSRLSRDDRPGH